MYLAVVAVLLVLSLYSLFEAGMMLYIRKKGKCGTFIIDKVEHTIVSGRGKYAKKDGVANCDYILRIHYAGKGERIVNTRVTVRARMKIRNGHYLPFFHEGDRIKMKSVGFAPRLVFVDLPEIAEKQGRLIPVLIWSFSALMLIAIFCYLLIA